MRKKRDMGRLALWASIALAVAGCGPSITPISIQHDGAAYLHDLLTPGDGDLTVQVTVSSSAAQLELIDVTWTLRAADSVLETYAVQVGAWKNNPGLSSIAIPVPIVGGIYEVRACMGTNSLPHECRQRFFSVAFPSGAHPVASPISYNGLENLLNTNPIRTIDDMLSVLPEYYRGQYALVTASGSLQSGTPLQPRVLMFGDLDDTVIAFTSKASTTGSESVELVQFDDASDAFQFRRIVFPEDGVAGMPVFGAINPPECMGCHVGPDPRPNWDAYSNWPGTYGHSIGVINAIEDLQEVQNYFAFLDGSPQNFPAGVLARYRHLGGYPIGFEVGGYPTVTTDNDDLTEKFATMNFQRIARKVKAELDVSLGGQSYDWDDLKWGIVGALACRDNSDAHLQGESVSVDFFPPGMDALETAMKQPGTSHRRCSDNTRESNGFVLSYEPYDLPDAFEAFGLTTEDWSMEIEVHGPRFSTKKLCFQLVLHALVDGDAELAPHFSPGYISIGQSGTGSPNPPDPDGYWRAMYVKGATIAEQITECETMACESQTRLGGTCN